MDLAITGVEKRFGRVEALRGVDFAVNPGEFFALLGPSGAGKTTLLRIIAGIEKADAGQVMAAGRDLASVPVRERNTAMVFQTFALYPHLSTFDNLAYPLREARRPAEEIKRRVGEIAEMLRLTHTLARKPGTLSGGEQQRCAIGRALVRRPKLLLLDEPLTNLDAKLRHDTRAEFKRLHRELGDTTMIYATPDQLEALSMGQRIGVLDLGRIVQIGTPQALYGEPKNTFVASLVGDPPINLVAATLRNTPGGRILETAFADIDAAPWASALKDFGHGTALRAGLRPQTLQPVQGAARGPRFGAHIVLTEPLGDVTILNLQPAKGERLKIVLPQEQAYGFKIGEELTCEIDPAQVVLFAADTGVAISRSQGAAIQGAAMG